MANRSELNSLIQRHIVERIPAQVYDSTPLLRHMLVKERVVERDQDSSVPFIHTKMGMTKKYDGLDNIEPQVPPETVADLDYPLCHYSHPFMLPWTKVRKSRGPASVMDLLDLKKKEAQIDIDDALATDLWTNNDASATTLLGIPRIISATTSQAVGGVSQDTRSVWAPKLVNAGAALSRAMIENVVIEGTFGSDGPKIALGNREMMKDLVALFTSNERFLDHDALRAGFTSVEVMGVPHFVDPNATGSGSGGSNNTITYLNTDWLEIAYDPEDWFVSRAIDENWPKQRVLGVQIFWSMQMRCYSRRHQGQIHTISS